MNTDPIFQTLAGAVVGGLGITLIARKFSLPTIVLLFAGGVAFGPEGLGLLDPASVESILPAIVSLAISVILFEGGLTLEPRDYLRSPGVIKRLLTIGAVVTWLGAALIVKVCFGASWEISLLAGSLVIVTGPTVIMPLLRRLRIDPEVASILHWEGVLIDAVGVFIAVLCYELVVVHDPGAAVLGFGGRFLAGALVGTLGGLALQRVLEKGWVPESLTNPFVLAAAVLLFTLAESWMHEAGLLAVTIAGIIVGRRRSEHVRQILTFKAELSDLLIGTLFLLLVCRLDLSTFLQNGPRLLLAVTLVMLIIRPLNVWLSTAGTGLKARQRAFLSWVAPRGIVAASMASLFALQLGSNPRFEGQAYLLEQFTYSVICATVVLQGLTAGWFARRLGLALPPANGWLLIGAHRLSREIARLLLNRGTPVLLVDANPRALATASAENLPTLQADAREFETIEGDERLVKVGNLLAMTDNSGLNQLLAANWKLYFGRDHVHAWNADDWDPAAISASFNGLPRPAVVSEELGAGTARLDLVSGPLSPGSIELLTFADGRFRAPRKGNGLPPDTQHLVLTRNGGYLERALARGARLTLRCSSLTNLYEQLVEAAVKREPRLSRETLRHDLAVQEQILPPFLGHGLAAPHTYSPDTTKRLCIYAELAPSLPVKAVKEPISQVYFIVSPSGDPEGHLATLAEIAMRHR